MQEGNGQGSPCQNAAYKRVNPLHAGDLEAALVALDEAEALHREQGVEHELMNTLSSKAFVLESMGLIELAKKSRHEASTLSVREVIRATVHGLPSPAKGSQKQV